MEATLAEGNTEFLFGSEMTSVDCDLYPQLALLSTLEGDTTNAAAVAELRSSAVLNGYIKRREKSLFPDLSDLPRFCIPESYSPEPW